MRTHILEALYLEHGNSRAIALDCLTWLLESGFLDDGMILGSLEFFTKAIDVMNGNLHERTPGFLARCYMFIFSFGSTIGAPKG